MTGVVARAGLETAKLDDLKFDMVLLRHTWGGGALVDFARSPLATYLVLAQLGLP